mgnify:CR=1 FL=1
MWVVYLLGVVVVMYFVSQIIESRDQNNRHKKFMHDMENWDKKYKTK